MNKVDINLSNCFGIKSMHYDFDFTDCNVYSVYAKNGTMKTSFAKTFEKIQMKKYSEIKDLIFNTLGIVDIKVDGVKTDDLNVFVIKSLDLSYEADISALLVDDNIKQQLQEVLSVRSSFLKKLEQFSGLKVKKISSGETIYELESTLVNDFGYSDGSLLVNIEKLDCAIKNASIFFPDVKYLSIFD